MANTPQDGSKLRLRNTDTNRFKVDTGRLRTQQQQTGESSDVPPASDPGATQLTSSGIHDPISLRETSSGKLKRVDNAGSTTAVPSMSGGGEKRSETVRLKVVRTPIKPGGSSPVVPPVLRPPLGDVAAPAETPVVPPVAPARPGVPPPITVRPAGAGISPPSSKPLVMPTLKRPSENTPPVLEVLAVPARPVSPPLPAVPVVPATPVAEAPVAAAPTSDKPVATSTIKLSMVKPGVVAPAAIPVAPSAPGTNTGAIKIRPALNTVPAVPVAPSTPMEGTPEAAPVPASPTASATVKVSAPPGIKLNLNKPAGASVAPVIPAAPAAEEPKKSDAGATVRGGGLKLRPHAAGVTTVVTPPAPGVASAAPVSPATDGGVAAQTTKGGITLKKPSSEGDKQASVEAPTAEAVAAAAAAAAAAVAASGNDDAISAGISKFEVICAVAAALTLTAVIAGLTMGLMQGL